MAQNPKDLDDVTCDVCGRKITPKERFIRLQTETLWSLSGVGQGALICKDCMIERFGVNEQVFNA